MHKDGCLKSTKNAIAFNFGSVILLVFKAKNIDAKETGSYE